MKRVAILMIACMFLWTQATPASEASATDVHGHGQAMPPGGTMLPSPETARDVLNATGRHGDWLRIPVGTAEIVTFVVHPDRADKAPVLIISEKDRPMSDWMRGIADQAAGEGYIALVPDTFAHLSQDARIDAVRKFPSRQGRRVTFEYVLLRDVNDSDEDAARLAALLRDLPVKVNLIPYNENPGLGFGDPGAERVAAFRKALSARGITAMVRKNRGRDIAAACGQLAVQA